MNIYALISGVVFLAYLPLAILALWSPANKQRRVFFWYIFASLAWSASSVLLNSDYMVLHKLALCKFNIITFTWVAVQFYNFSRSYGYGDYQMILGGGYIILVLVFVLVILDYIPKSIVLGNGVSYSIGNWFIMLSIGLAALAAENIRAQILAFKRSAKPVLKRRNIFFIAGISIMLVFTIPMGYPALSHLPLAHVGNIIAASLWTYVLIALPSDRAY